MKSINTWGHLNSQECVGISPELFHELVYPTQQKLAKEFIFRDVYALHGNSEKIKRSIEIVREEICR